MSARLEVASLSVSVRSTSIVQDVCLCASAGEVVALFGPSGAGKSTTLLAIAGLLGPQFGVRGSVSIDDRDISSLAPEDRSHAGLSIVLQGLALFPDRDILANVAYPLLKRGEGRRAARGRAQALLKEFRLDGLEGRRPAQLSGGQQQRVALARAMIYGPKLLLLDEPFKGLDRELREEVLLEVRRLARAGTSIVLVTHETEDLQLVADRVTHLRGGTMVGEEEINFADGRSPLGFRSLGRTDTAAWQRADPRAADWEILEIRALGGAAAMLLRERSGRLRWLRVSLEEAARLAPGEWLSSPSHSQNFTPRSSSHA